jgi:hypothetical protein
MALAACVGSLISVPMLFAMLGNANDYPALYLPAPTCSMAPFLAQMAADVDEGLLESRKTMWSNPLDVVDDHDHVFPDLGPPISREIAIEFTKAAIVSYSRWAPTE